MNKKKAVSFVFLIITSIVFGGLSGFAGSNLIVDNGRIEFRNTSFSIYIGEEAGLNDQTDLALGLIEAHNIGIGRRALSKVKAHPGEGFGTRNVCIGGHCMHEAIDADRNSCFGTACLFNNKNGKMNTTGGYHAGASHETDYAVIFGAFAEEKNRSAHMSVTLGAYAARYNEGKKNVLLGGSVAARVANINNSVYLGAAAGNQQISGDNNIILGFNQNLEDLMGSNQMNLGGVFKSSNVYDGHVRMRKNAGIELVNDIGDAYRITVDSMGNLDVNIVP